MRVLRAGRRDRAKREVVPRARDERPAQAAHEILLHVPQRDIREHVAQRLPRPVARVLAQDARGGETELASLRRVQHVQRRTARMRRRLGRRVMRKTSESKSHEA
eukprot:7384375-Prymnesium_polylepis.2